MMADCKECAKKLLDAAEQIYKIAASMSGIGGYKDSVTLRAQHYLDAIDIVCPDIAAAKHSTASTKGEPK